MMLRIKLATSYGGASVARRRSASIFDGYVPSPPQAEISPLPPATVPAASEDAVRIALHLREAPARGGGRIVTFLPASPDVDASVAVADAVCGLHQLGERPVLVLDMRASGDDERTPLWLLTLPRDRDEFVARAEGELLPAAMARPFAGRQDRLAFAASREFADLLDDARARYPYVLCIGSDISKALDSLIAAPLADGVVLAVAPSRVTRPQLTDLTAQLRRARANVLGFVAEAPGLGKAAGRSRRQ